MRRLRSVRSSFILKFDIGERVRTLQLLGSCISQLLYGKGKVNAAAIKIWQNAAAKRSSFTIIIRDAMETKGRGGEDEINFKIWKNKKLDVKRLINFLEI